MYLVFLNKQITARSLDIYGQGNIFSLDVGRCYKTALFNANHGLLDHYDNQFRAGFRTLPRGNDPNWEISSVFKFNYRFQAYYAASIIKDISKYPRLVNNIRQEFIDVEGNREIHYSLDRIRWNKLKSIRCLPFPVNDHKVMSSMFNSVKLKHDVRRVRH